MYKYLSNRKPNRTGAAAVEFAVVAPIFFLTLFACFEFSKISMVESFAEDAAFRAARHVVVVGATTQESRDLANETLAIVGVENAQITIEPSINGAIQTEIDDDTDRIAVRIAIPMAENLFLANFINDFVMEKEAVIFTERYREATN